ncbi:conserved hypothetical protein [Thermotomaculum hydrothermale]|uniref:YdbS-like PH domain-containing protein n=1 Tax=Thermotomaculum hydrothermale TaxID=981385 RepID=A0A7R6Q0L9_9BACT|nr:PH domain-containing protein [Thermotomaculum hydrothermale]BBB33358.1 conserved hypothetical protein [Thermotomaculum hydrothermale]
MSYIEKNLLAGEKLVYQAKLHWIIFIWSVLFLLIAIIFFMNKLAPFGWFFILLAIFQGLFSFITYSTSEFAVTNKRIIVKVGFIRRHSLEILLTKVEAISVNQGIWGRILNFGTIIITGSGGTKEPFHKIAAPLEFRKRAQEQIAAIQESKQ